MGTVLENNKKLPRTQITLDSSEHRRLKSFADKNGLLIFRLTDKIIKEWLDKNEDK